MPIASAEAAGSPADQSPRLRGSAGRRSPSTLNCSEADLPAGGGSPFCVASGRLDYGSAKEHPLSERSFIDPLQSSGFLTAQEVRMPVETPSIFSKIIEEHLELKRRNSELERELPLSRYVHDDPFQNHPLFKTEEQARLEETMDGAEPAVTVAVAAAIEPEDALQAWTEAGPETVPTPAAAEDEEGLWGRSRDFDWGD